MPQLLLELFQEEIPARMQKQAADDLKRLMVKALTERGLPASDVTTHVTPRRLTLVIEDLPAASAAVSEELKGPRTSAPPAALDGFLKKTGLTKDQLSSQADPKGDFYIARIEKDGRPAAPLIAEAIVETVRAFPWPKSMKWEASGLQWVRPLRSILCLFDGAVVPVEIAGLTASNITRGHRQMANDPFEVRDFEDYETKLRERRVILDREERKAMIDEQAEIAAANAGLAFRDDDELLEEVAGLVEFPVVLTGSFDPAFLEVPQEVLIGTMRKNQKYFALTENDPPPPAGEGDHAQHGGGGRLAPKFLIVSNLEARDGGKAIIAGNERVLRARLSDAKFFWDNDRQVTLEARLPKLKDIVFHAKLGTQADRVARIERLAGEIAEKIGANVDDAKLAARLCKADLVSGTVGEFPEVQGTIGGYLAREEFKTRTDINGDAVADAIANHYRPQGPADSVPTNKVAIAVALADKLDTLVGFFAIDEKPTGSKDPYALRRAALGVVRLWESSGINEDILSIILKPTLRFVTELQLAGAPAQSAVDDLLAAFTSEARKQAALLQLTEDRQEANKQKLDAAVAHAITTWALVRDFILDRTEVLARDRGISPGVVRAARSGWVPDEIKGNGFRQIAQSNVYVVLALSDALSAFLATEDGANLLAGTKRAANILRIEEKKDGTTYAATVDAALLTAPEEKSLSIAIDAAMPRIEAAIAAEDFAAAMTALAALRAPVDAFFEKVKVNDDNPAVRINRLNLLARIKQAAGLVADFSKIEG